jgi:di/tricarboxylate transporter
MSYLLAVFAVWILWTTLGMIFTTPAWFQYGLGITLGTTFAVLIKPSDWYLGIGIGGAAGFLVLVSDVLLVTADAIRAGVLVRLGRRG